MGVNKVSAAEAVRPGAALCAEGFSSAAIVWTPEVQKEQKQKPKKALDPGKHKTCECWVRAPSFRLACRFAAEVERLSVATPADPE